LAISVSGCDQSTRESASPAARSPQPDARSPQSSPAPQNRDAAEIETKGDSFKLNTAVTAGGQELFAATIFFVGHYAVEFTGESESEPLVIYNLHDMSWRDIPQRRTVRISDCKAWAKASAERSRATLAKAPDPGFRRFVEAMLNPQFTAAMKNDKLTLTNDVVKYEIESTQNVSKARLAKFFAYDILNAYRKAMVDRKLPPFPQLAVDEELKARGMAPNEMNITITTPQAAVRLRATVHVNPLAAEEKERVLAVVRR
jgi:hypothetical protein